MNQLNVCLAIISISVLEALALYYGVDGALMAGSFAIIGGLGGYSIHRKVKK